MKKMYFLWSLLGLLTLHVGWAQKTISGTVNDDTGLPLPGATVVIDGTNQGITTDFDGNFSIDASEGDILVVSYVGYSDYQLTVGNQDSYTLTLSPDNELEEVVVTSLGIRREKQALGYAISEVNEAAIEQRAEGDIGRVLSGKASGVQITNQSGISGSGTSIIIRGFNSFSQGNQPLFIVKVFLLVVKEIVKTALWMETMVLLDFSFTLYLGILYSKAENQLSIKLG